MFRNAKLTVRSPAKLIISGEHAVIYDQPALAMAINRYTEVTTKLIQQPLIKFRSFDFGITCSETLSTLQQLQKQILVNYARFLKGQCSIKDVLTKPFELLQFSVTNVIERLNIQLPKGIHIEIGSKIPIGCGMGSSAAAIVGTLHALLKQVGVDIENNKFISISKESENLQHGKSSGLDVHITKNGGTCKFQKGEITSIPNPHHKIFMINTGKPETTTGECVTEAAKYFNSSELSNNFGEVTNYIQQAMLQIDEHDVKYGIRENHKLLSFIGVVPQVIQDMITRIELVGGAAKICGAGAVRGDNAGVLLALGDQHLLTEIVNKCGFQLETFDVDILGTRVV